jgi:hypothetical protein
MPKVHTLPSVKKKPNRQRKSGVSSLERKQRAVLLSTRRKLVFFEYFFPGQAVKEY